jgi:hypothetical protein
LTSAEAPLVDLLGGDGGNLREPVERSGESSRKPRTGELEQDPVEEPRVAQLDLD